MKFDNNRLATFIAIRSIAGQTGENRHMVQWLCTELERIGFNCRIEGQNKTNQPLLVASYPGRNCDKKLVLYNHYDVAPVKPSEQWHSKDPFVLQQIEDRLYARGIADNKGPLIARLEALDDMLSSNTPIPNILWLIQGEEEILQGERVANALMATEIANFKGSVFVEETGFYDVTSQQQLAFLWSPTIPAEELNQWHNLLEQTLEPHRVEYRHLNKLNGVSSCPLLNNLPPKAVYIGFGPNDKYHRIHSQNESLDAKRLALYRQQFARFVRFYAND